MEWIANPEIWISLLTLTVLEVVLGIDNIVFISILAGKLPKDQQAKARNWGLGLAMFTRVLLLLSIAWIMRLTARSEEHTSELKSLMRRSYAVFCLKKKKQK